MNELYFTSVFDKNITAYNNGCKLIINQGGTRSGKTWSILQLLFLIALNSKSHKVISVVSHALPHLKLGAMRDFDTILLNYGIIPGNIKNHTDNYYTIGKSIIEFFGTDTLDKVHGPTRDILFVNEANFIKYDIYDQLAIRTKGCKIIDFNPTQVFWCQDDIMNLYPYVLIKSTYKDNEHLTSEQIKQIEAKKGIEKYANWWRVYGEGEIGNLEGVIYSDWEYGEFDNSLPFGYGLDFGFYPDPDAMVKVAIDNKRKRIYLDECIYENNNGTEALRKSIVSNDVGQSLIIADSAESRLISDLSGTFNIRKVVKKPGSVIEGIRLLQDYKFIVTHRSYNLVKELKNYIWSDKKAGLPIDAFNHCFTGDTNIITSLGSKSIKDIKKDDLVLTSTGFQKVLKRFNNGRKKIFVYDLYFSDLCIRLECTDNHKLKTKSGWKQIKDITEKDEIYLHKSLTGKSIQNILEKDIFQKEQKECTSLFMNTTSGKHQRGLVSIIKTRTLKTIALKIYHLSRFQNTLLSILKKDSLKIQNTEKDLLMEEKEKQKNGTQVQLEYSGIKNTMINARINYIVKYYQSVMFAIRNFMQHSIRDSVPIIANQNSEEIINLILNQEYVHGVEKNLSVENIQSKEIVQSHVLLRKECITASEQEVYDLMVDNEHEYFANGVLVHNCLDAARYYAMSVTVINKTRLVSI